MGEPWKYLGLPGEWGRAKTNALSWLKERILSKLEGWEENLLNHAGKEVLIKAVIQAILSYAMSIVRLPKSFCRNIWSQIARFWWSPYGKQRGIHWKRWGFLTTMKKDGGMGFKEFKIMNSLSKLGVCYITLSLCGVGFSNINTSQILFFRRLQKEEGPLGPGIVCYMAGMWS